MTRCIVDATNHNATRYFVSSRAPRSSPGCGPPRRAVAERLSQRGDDADTVDDRDEERSGGYGTRGHVAAEVGAAAAGEGTVRKTKAREERPGIRCRGVLGRAGGPHRLQEIARNESRLETALPRERRQQDPAAVVLAPRHDDAAVA